MFFEAVNNLFWKLFDHQVSHQIKMLKTLPQQFELRSTEDKHFSVVTKEAIGSSTRFVLFDGTADEITNSDSYWEVGTVKKTSH